MNETSIKNFYVFTTVSSFWATVSGLIGPFYVIHVQKVSGGIEKLGMAFGIMVLLQSVSTYFAGHYSDRLGRRPFLIFAALSNAVILLLYTMVTDTWQVYLLQALLGITSGVAGTIRTTFLGDLTTRSRRGKEIGKFNAVVSLASALGLAAGGYMVKLYGIHSLFHSAAAVIALSSALLFLIEEEGMEPDMEPVKA